MSSIYKIIQELYEQKNPIANPLIPEEIQTLIKELINRLNSSEDILDSSIKSLSVLEKLLIDFCSKDSFQELNNDYEELLHFIRELAAYLGNVIVVNAQGEWAKESRNLWSTHVYAKGGWKTKKGKELSNPEKVGFIVGGEATLIIENIIEGQDSGLKRLERGLRTRYLKGI